ncbi:hypothetical protein N7471_005885 [Penicillium samsonianum]|uniref:uncharacterized protein n=1 Tax=Penicillium samsonianum TaxID=1882272 RepID=UPI0025496C45|nr:uncharacterized protein N7471_005885 [Penicillium samsonianum]KAJ6139399.1 hypothetical protein N7471_005885 [Penicillium samsonianum]
MCDVIVKIVWALLTATLVLTQTHAQTVSKDECATGVHAIIARGEGGGDDLNVLSTLSDLILKQIPGSTTLGLPYDHENVLTNSAKLHTVHDGAVLMQQFVQEYSESCPQTKIVVVGYSMGAVLMMDSLCGTSEIGLFFVAPLARFYNSTIIAAIAYGDETYIPGMPWNLAIVITVFPNAAHHTQKTTMQHTTLTYGSTMRTSWTSSNTVWIIMPA